MWVHANQTSLVPADPVPHGSEPSLPTPFPCSQVCQSQVSPRPGFCQSQASHAPVGCSQSGAWSLSVKVRLGSTSFQFPGNSFSPAGLKYNSSLPEPGTVSQVRFPSDLGPGPLNLPSPLPPFQFLAPQCPPFDFLPGNPRGFGGILRGLSWVPSPDLFSSLRGSWPCLLRGSPLSLSPPLHPLFRKHLLNSAKSGSVPDSG